MKLNEEIKRIIELSDFSDKKIIIAYHGTRTDLPFSKFDPKAIGTGFVSFGTKFHGFFFTTSEENAEYYTEYFLCRVSITNAHDNPLKEKHPPTVLKQASQDDKIYIIKDYLDGSVFSDIIVVPMNQLNNVRILEWIFVGDEEWLFKKYDEFFGGEPDEETGDLFVDQSIIKQMINMIDLDLEYLLKIPVFKKYYDSKE